MKGNLLAPFGITAQSLRGMDFDTQRAFVEAAVRNLLRFHHPDRFATERGKQRAQERFAALQDLWNDVDPDKYPEVFAEALAWYSKPRSEQVALLEEENRKLRITAAVREGRWRGILRAYADPNPSMGLSLVHCAGAVFHLTDRMAELVRRLPFRGSSFDPQFPHNQFVLKVGEDGSCITHQVKTVKFNGHDEPPPGLSWVYRPTKEEHMAHARGWRISSEGTPLDGWRPVLAMESSHLDDRGQAWPVRVGRLLPSDREPVREDIVAALDTGYPFSVFEEFGQYLSPYAKKFRHLIGVRRDPKTGESRWRLLGYIQNLSAPGHSPQQLGYHVGADIDPSEEETSSE